ncbi:MAG: hydroxyacid dehydrogenase [bacterium]
MPHILVAGKLHDTGLALLAGIPGVTFTHIEEISEASYASHMPQADALILRTQPLTAATLAMANNLQVVSRHGVGYDAVDVVALNARKIPLCIVGDVNSVSVAEHAMMLILACAKQLVRSDRATRIGPWVWRNRLESGEISGRRLLIAGYGRIGRHLARMASGFGMQIRAVDPYLAVHGWPDGPVAETSLTDGLQWADIVSLHVPKTGAPLIGAAELGLLRPGAIIVNTARGGIIDETALVDALASGHLAAAGLDVFEEEPPPPDHPLLAFDNLILTPHTAGISRQSAERMAVASVQNVLDHFNGCLDPDLIVNKDALK